MTIHMGFAGRVRPAGDSQGSTLVELLTVLGVLLILTAILIPAATKAITKANRIKCASNLRQIYLDSWDFVDRQGSFSAFPGVRAGEIPLAGRAPPRVPSLASSEEARQCPSSEKADRDLYPIDYGLNGESYGAKTFESGKLLSERLASEKRDKRFNRYCVYLFDEFREDQKRYSYRWHARRSALGVDNKMNLLFADQSGALAEGWNRHAWPTELVDDQDVR